MALPTHSSRRILHPANTWFVLLSLGLAVLLNLMPFARGFFWPDFAAVILLFWCVREPAKVGLGLAFLCGFILDVSQGKILGINSANYVLLAFVGHFLASRLLWFNIAQQTAHVLPLLLGSLLMQALLGLLFGLSWPVWWTFLAAISGTILWPIFNYILLLPQFRPYHHDNIRPL